jgi:hypothetical protein
VLNRLKKLWRSAGRHPVILLLIGLAVGVPAGWFLGIVMRLDNVRPLPLGPTAYSELSNEELRARSARLVSEIRALVGAFNQEDSRLRFAADENSSRTDSKDEAEKIRRAWLDDSAKLHDGYLDRYKKAYWSEAILLRTAMITRLPAVPGTQNAQLFFYPTNILGVEVVANALELLGKSLPQTAALKP